MPRLLRLAQKSPVMQAKAVFGLTYSPWNTCKNTGCCGQGQLWHLTCTEGRDLSNYVKMSTIQLSRPKKRQKPRNVDPKIPMKPCSTSSLVSNPTVLKAFPKCQFFPTKWILVNAQQKKKNGARKAKEEERKESFSSWHFASGTEGRAMLETAFWEVLAHCSHTVTRKRLD